MNFLLRQGFDGQATFGEPQFLWLLAAPALLLLAWVWRRSMRNLRGRY